MLRCIPEYPFQVYVQQRSAAVRIKLPKFLLARELQAMQTAACEVAMRVPLEGQVPAVLGWCLSLSMTENADFTSTFEEYKCNYALIGKVC